MRNDYKRSSYCARILDAASSINVVQGSISFSQLFSVRDVAFAITFFMFTGVIVMGCECLHALIGCLIGVTELFGGTFHFRVVVDYNFFQISFYSISSPCLQK